MSFVPRSFETIRDDMINFVRSHTTLTDFEPGSVIRTIIEAAALEDDEQYFQIAQLLDAFSYRSATGEDLDERVKDFDIIRLQPATATGEIVIRDGALTTNQLAFDVASTATTVELDDTSDFPTSGFPYDIRIGEATTSVEDVACSANNTTTNVLTVTALTNSHSIGDRVSLKSGSDKVIPSSLQVQRPAAGGLAAVRFITTEQGLLVNGNYESSSISAKAVVPGSGGNIGTGQITAFTSASPFTGALVTNNSPTVGGRDIETDADLRGRARDAIQGLSKGTVLALKDGVLGITDPVSGKRVATANVLETVANEEVIVYVDDGTGFVPDQNQLARSEVDNNTSQPSNTIPVVDGDDFPDSGYVILTPEVSARTELRAYTTVDRTVTPNTLGMPVATGQDHNAGEEVVLVDVLTLAAESGQNFFHTTQYPIVQGSFRLWLDEGTGFTLQTLGTDYLLNRGTGDVEFTGSGVTTDAVVVASYTHYTGLLFEVQRVINGDPDDEVFFPGIKAAGVIVNVDTPTIRRITVSMSIAVEAGFSEIDLAPLVVEAVENYISGLGIGDDVIVAEIIDRAMGVTGMFNVTVTEPSSDVVILEDELPVAYSASGTTLVSAS